MNANLIHTVPKPGTQVWSEMLPLLPITFLMEFFRCSPIARVFSLLTAMMEYMTYSQLL